MAADTSHNGGQSAPQQINKKRKVAPGSNQPSVRRDAGNKRPRHNAFNNRFQNIRDARTISSQTSSKALKNGELDVEKFVKAREYEVQALEKGLRDSKKVLTKRAFQQVPKELRRRTASHNVKRVPKKLQARAKREMAEDNTPTTKKKPSRHMRLRIDTIKRLRALGEKKKAEKERRKEEKRQSYGAVTVHSDPRTVKPGHHAAPSADQTQIKTRAPRVKQATLSKPPLPKAKFRKRQVNKSWLPTHLFHTKRARMTEPSQPLWRFAVPLTPSQKGYRTTHRAMNHRGAVMWDMSYMATISLEGKQHAVLSMLRQLGVHRSVLEKNQGALWRDGKRTGQGWLFEREAPHSAIAPVTMVWNADVDRGQHLSDVEQRHAHLLLRVHPSAFLQVWEEVVRLSRCVKPAVRVEDLRFEVGSIEVTGPGSTEALVGALWPLHGDAQPAKDEPPLASQSSTFRSLNSLATPSVLPNNASLAFEIQDPRLHHPPRTLPVHPHAEESLLRLLSSWPPDSQPAQPSSLFSRRARLASQSAMPSQKSINRRKSLASPGEYPTPRMSDPQIPILLYVSQPETSARSHTSSWTILAPWKCIPAMWYSLQYYPLSTGGQPRFGGLLEQRQICFEAGEPWFPGDFPGTSAGWEWELRERRMRWDEWSKRPKGKRIAWDKVDLGGGKKGEVGEGWACDWQRLLEGPPVEQSGFRKPEENAAGKEGETTAPSYPAKPPALRQFTSSQAQGWIASKEPLLPTSEEIGAIVSVRLQLLPRGTPKAAARVYRLPSSAASPSLRAQWLALHPSQRHRLPKNHALPPVIFSKDAPSHAVQRDLARLLLRPPPTAGDSNYPICPGEEDLIGFVTTGGYNLEAGGGTGVANLLMSKVRNDVEDGEKQLCIVRNAGESAGRLARWNVF